MSTSTNLTTVLKNPKCQEFQNIYVCLGKVEGKKKYAADCRRLKLQISIQGMQTIEKGFSRKERIAYSNNCDVNSSISNWGNDSKRQYSYDENQKKVDEENRQKELEEEKALALQKAKEEKTKRIAAKKAKKLEKTKKTLAELDSWEDFELKI
tara:strand:+ start:115 stop:573 length:459 start_codon:yes stop_codon:yes gene_type:complete